jgi:imidazolonepropionase
MTPAEALSACTVNAGHVLARADRLGRVAPGYEATLTLLAAPDWRYLAYHLGGDLVEAVLVRGEVVWKR